MPNTKPNQGTRRSVLTDDEKLLIAKCKAECVLLRKYKSRLLHQVDKVSRDIRELSNVALAEKFGCSPSTIDLVPVEGE